MTRALPWLLAALPATAHARPGDWDAPLEIPGVPFVHASDTAPRGADRAARYACREDLAESGPEVLYVFQAPAAGRLTAWVEGDADPVDLDVHLLSSPALDAGGTATDCLARANTVAEADVGPGPVYIAVDTYEDATRAGPYRLHVDFQAPDTWYRRPVAQGVTLETKAYPALFGAVQTGSVLRLDPATPGLTIKPVHGCGTTSSMARAAGAAAAINAGFFNVQTCESVSLVKIDGQLIATNARGRSAFGAAPDGTPLIDWVDAGRDWPAAHHAVGGLARLVSAGEIDVQGERDGADPAFVNNRHPRTAAGIAPDGGVILATVDGRTEAGAGMSLAELAQWFVWLGAGEAVNLDGGGSTTLWVAGQPFDGVINFPSDNGQADHAGQRRVNSVLAVFAPPLQREALFLTPAPGGVVRAGERAVFEVVVADPDGAALRLVAESDGRGALAVEDRGDGTAEVSYIAAHDDPDRVTLEIRALDADREDALQRGVLQIEGRAPASDGGDTPAPVDDATRVEDALTASDGGPERPPDAAGPDDAARAPDATSSLDPDAGESTATPDHGLATGGDAATVGPTVDGALAEADAVPPAPAQETGAAHSGGCAQAPAGPAPLWLLPALLFRRRRRLRSERERLADLQEPRPPVEP